MYNADLEKLKRDFIKYLYEKKIEYKLNDNADLKAIDLTFWLKNTLFKIMFKQVEKSDQELDLEAIEEDIIFMSNSVLDDQELWLISNHEQLEEVKKYLDELLK
ncbi:hypothetical protein [Mycoplasmopsis agassizii]|uniref:Uncharacterized protein n=1 Tax=Mycoplasmopsis agassizii TaxID=33922 RepID=A0ABX4H4C3_9BACT|nr:hypothetical protein [Mycoplasmopsis agassizii]PAF54738.1 hypothetical protein CJF60_03295 [Mycoplasmopsis agassizii]SMC15895.1 hypothetical protein SAMN02745179_00143 [Mycoplasmopsis agassizii]